jgi:hypothetical protein
MAIPLAGCLLRGKPPTTAPVAPVKPVSNPAVTPPAKPPELSIVQTEAQLPAPQPIPEEALATTLPPEEGPPAPPAPVVKPPTRRLPVRNAPPPAVETPVAPPPGPVDPGRPTVQDVPAEQQTRLREEAKATRHESQQILGRVQSRRLTRDQRESISYIQGFLKLSEDAERRGDPAQAKQLADKALVLAKELR